MAKKSKRSTNNQSKASHTPGSENTSGIGRSMGKVIGCVALLAFVLMDELWMGIGVFTLVFAALYGIQVFAEKSKSWYSSLYLYTTLACGALAYAEYRYQVISNLLRLGK